MPTARELADSMFSRAREGRAFLTSKQRVYLENLIQREIDKVEYEQKKQNPHRQARACVGDRAWQENGKMCLSTDSGYYVVGTLPNRAGCLWHER